MWYSRPLMNFISTRTRSRASGLILGFYALSLPATAQALLPEIVVLAERQSGGNGPRSTADWNRAELKDAAPRTLDELLARDPSFSLYRRQTAVFGNPTSAGVSLRNTGATATSRSLLVLDGIPQNDPFGGWIYWSRYDAAALDSIRIVPSAQAAVWGNQSPAGIIQMSSNAPFRNRHSLKIGGGSQGTYGASSSHQMTNAEETRAVSVSAFGLHSDGFFAVDSSQRGSIDRKLDLDLAGANAKFSFLAAPGLVIEPMLSYYKEDRGNGTPLAQNSTEALDFSLRVTGEDGNSSWQALAYHQRREFESVFSTVSADRTAEILALDQYDVPGRGTGGAYIWKNNMRENFTLTAGADTRHVSGVTHETVGTFREREAGGEQAFFGIFAAAAYEIAPATQLDASLRLDAWQLTEGRRIETSLASGNILRDDRYENRDGFEPSGAVELNHQLNETLLSNISISSGFRLPTLNELHRPFRVRNDIVEANPELDPERFISIEGGFTWNPTAQWEVRGTLFHHWISDAIANVPITDSAEQSEIFGTIPPGGTGSQRRNVDQARVFGIQSEIVWKPREALMLRLAGVWMETEFTESSGQPLLEDKPFPQAPELRLIADASWQATGQLGFFGGCEYGASQFDDALASRSLPDYTSFRVGASWKSGAALYQLRVENLFDDEIQTGLSSNGIRTYAAPRSLWAGAEWEF